MAKGLQFEITPEARIAELTRRLDDITRMVSDLVWEVDAALRFTNVSDRIFDITGQVPHQLIGMHISDAGRFPDIDDAALAGRFRHPFQKEFFQLTKEDGTELSFLLNSLPVFDANSGAFTGALGTAENVTSRLNQERTIRESEKFLRSIADTIPAFVAYHDIENRFRFANQYFQKLGFDPEALIGRSADDIFSAESMERFKPYRDKALAGEVVKFDNLLLDANGERIHTQVSISPDFDEGGEIAGYIVLSADITDRLQAEAETGNARANLEKAQRMAQIGSWERNLLDDSVYWSPEMYRMLDYDPEHVVPSSEKLLARIHPEDRARVVQAQKSAIAEKALHYTNEFRILRRDGSMRHIVGGGEIGYGADGAAEWIVGTSQDVTAARRVRDTLEATKREAENANSAKSEFLSSMSHELRTPMNAILGYAQLLLQNKKEPVSDTQQRQISQILKSGQHLLMLINDILDLSRIETGQVAFEVTAMDAASAVDECVGLIAALAEKSDLKIINHLKSNPPPPILADGIRLKQALLNLLSNAIKFNAPGGRVDVSARPLNAEFVRISISDTGIGIPEEKAVELFEPFGRLDAEQRGIEGTGIGLTITKELVERMKGTIGYSSKPGKGSTFWLDIPTAASGLSEGHAAAAGLDLDSDEDGARRTVILYIEDDISNLQLFKEVVGHMPGTELFSAHSAEAGIQIARNIQPNIIVMDINLPGISGLEAVRILREDAKTRSIPVIALSAAAMPEDIKRGERAGFYRYMTKPFIVDEIIATIDDALEKTISANNPADDTTRNAAE